MKDGILPIATIGLHGSASTWVFNVAREIAIAACGEAKIAALYADRIDDLPTDLGQAEWIVIKSHHGSFELDDWLRAREAARILSLRDPRDAALSMSQRFRASLRSSISWLLNDCRRIVRILPDPHLLLKYEDRFFDDLKTVDKIANWLDLRLDSDAASAIFARYATQAVRAFAARVLDLPPERLSEIPQFSTYDQVTHIHHTHIGDGRSGKCRDLDAQTRDNLTEAFLPYLEEFGYLP